MKITWWHILVLALGFAAAAVLSYAQDKTTLGSAVPGVSKPAGVESRVEDIEDRLERLERAKTEAGPASSAQAKLTSAFVTSGGSDGFVLQSAEGDFKLQIGLLLQADGQFDLSDSNHQV